MPVNKTMLEIQLGTSLETSYTRYTQIKNSAVKECGECITHGIAYAYPPNDQQQTMVH